MFIIDIIGERVYLKTLYKKYFSNVINTKVFFFSRHYTGYLFYFINKLSYKNKIIYIPDPAADLLPTKTSYIESVNNIIKIIVFKIIFGRKIITVKFMEEFIPSMSTNYIKKITSRMISRKERDRMLVLLDKREFAIYNEFNYDVLYFGHNAKNIRSSRSEWEKILNDIFNILKKYYPEKKIRIKLHPARESDISINVGILVDKYIPAEFLYNRKVKVYITPYSRSLSNLKNGLTISLIDLIPTNNLQYKSKIKERFKKMSYLDHYFPETLDEFENILIDIKNKEINENILPKNCN